MTEIGFYHLTRTSAEQALPQLLGRTLAAGQRAVVRCRTAEQVAALDVTLWACADPDWLPHGTERNGHAEHQPIWLTCGVDVPNGARFLFLLHGADGTGTGTFERVFDLFDGRDEAAVQAARARWTEAKAAGHALAYLQQGERGWAKRD